MYQYSEPTSVIAAIPGGLEGTRVTLRLMRRLVGSGKKSPAIRQAAASVVSGLAQKDWVGEVARMHAFLRDNIRYVRDIRGVETLHTPEKILSQGWGDCDDKAVLLASMLESIGHPTRFVAVGFKPKSFSHVLVETKIGNKWVSLETTEPVCVGWKPKGVKSRMVIHN